MVYINRSERKPENKCLLFVLFSNKKETRGPSMSIPSLGIGKRFRSSKKPWKPFTKLCKAVKKASQHIAALLSSSPSPARKKHDSTSLSPYFLKTSLYHCPCNYHKRQREKLQKRLVTATEYENLVEMSTRGLVERDSPDSILSLEEEEVDEREKEDTKYSGEVDKRAELFIKTFREESGFRGRGPWKNFTIDWPVVHE